MCGGQDDNRTYRRECWLYDAQAVEWREGGRLREARHSSAAAFHPDHGWVITGGYDGARKSTAERTRNGSAFDAFAKLPIALSDHCMVSLDGSDEGDFLVAGGFGNGYNKRTFIYKNSEWIPAADMPTARRGLACGTVRGEEGGAVGKVVAVGGRRGSQLSKVEVYDVASNTWTDGASLPVPVANAAVVPFDDTFLVIGGYMGKSVYSDKVYRYNNSQEETWTEMTDLKLSEAKESVVAMIV